MRLGFSEISRYFKRRGIQILSRKRKRFSLAKERHFLGVSFSHSRVAVSDIVSSPLVSGALPSFTFLERPFRWKIFKRKRTEIINARLNRQRFTFTLIMSSVLVIVFRSFFVITLVISSAAAAGEVLDR